MPSRSSRAGSVTDNADRTQRWLQDVIPDVVLLHADRRRRFVVRCSRRRTRCAGRGAPARGASRLRRSPGPPATRPAIRTRTPILIAPADHHVRVEALDARGGRLERVVGLDEVLRRRARAPLPRLGSRSSRKTASANDLGLSRAGPARRTRPSRITSRDAADAGRDDRPARRHAGENRQRHAFLVARVDLDVGQGEQFRQVGPEAEEVASPGDAELRRERSHARSLWDRRRESRGGGSARVRGDLETPGTRRRDASRARTARP